MYITQTGLTLIDPPLLLINTGDDLLSDKYSIDQAVWDVQANNIKCGTSAGENKTNVHWITTATRFNNVRRCAGFISQDKNDAEAGKFNITFEIKYRCDRSDITVTNATKTASPYNTTTWSPEATIPNGQILDYYNRGSQFRYNYMNDTSGGFNSVIISSPFPVFLTQSLCDNYLATGEGVELALNYNAQIESTSTGIRYYFKTTTVKTNFGDTAREILSRDEGKFIIPNGSKLYGYVVDETPYNVRLVCTADEWYYSPEWNGTEYTKQTQLPTTKIGTPDIIFNGIDYFFSTTETNIPIFKSQADGDRYEAGTIDESDGIGGTGYQASQNATGTGITSTDLDCYETGIYVSASGGYSTTHLFSNTQIQSVFNLLYDEETNPWEQIKNGLRFYGENPVESVLGLYYCPIDLSQFCSTFNQSYVMFGSYKLDCAEHPTARAGGKMVTLASTQIVAQFNDYRDYTNVVLYLYLPFIGIMTLDTASYIYKTMTIKCTMDIRTHTIKYWIFANNLLVDTYEGSVGVTLPIIASDFVGKAQENISAITGLVGTGKGAVESIAKGATGDVVGGAVSAIDVPMGMLKNTMSMANRTPKNVVGNLSSALSCYDVKYPFLVVEVQQTEEPQNLNATYGKPCNAITTIGNCKGFTLCDNVHLECDATAEELDEIQSLLSSGIIV